MEKGHEDLHEKNQSPTTAQKDRCAVNSLEWADPDVFRLDEYTTFNFWYWTVGHDFSDNPRLLAVRAWHAGQLFAGITS